MEALFLYGEYIKWSKSSKQLEWNGRRQSDWSAALPEHPSPPFSWRFTEKAPPWFISGPGQTCFSQWPWISAASSTCWLDISGWTCSSSSKHWTRLLTGLLPTCIASCGPRCSVVEALEREGLGLPPHAVPLQRGPTTSCSSRTSAAG